MLGFTEAGNFPAANKTIAEWFPRKERAFATGFYNSGTNVGAIVSPLCVPYIASAWGWEWAFILTGAVGLLWLFFWYRMYAPPAANWPTASSRRPNTTSSTATGTNRRRSRPPPPARRFPG